MYMKKSFVYLIIFIVLIISIILRNNYNLKKESGVYCYYEKDNNYILVEKNIISKIFVSYLYKNSKDEYVSKIEDYNSSNEIELKDLIKEDKIMDYNKKIEELIFLKYPKYISSELIKEEVKKNYIFRNNELVIYFNDYKINPIVNEILYLKVNYNEIKDFLNFPFTLDNVYENESGYNYTNAKKSIAFTFDDSPNKNKTDKILNYLKDYHFHATFFVVGEKILHNKDLLINIKNNGNEIGSHSYNHKNISKLTEEELINDFENVNNIYKTIFNEDLKIFRPPYGLIKDKQLNILNVSYIMWNLDTNDWRYRNSDYIVNYVLDNVKDGDIILFHDTYESTVAAVEKLLPLLYSRGYQVMSVSELANLKNIKLINNKIYYSFN